MANRQDEVDKRLLKAALEVSNKVYAKTEAELDRAKNETNKSAVAGRSGNDIENRNGAEGKKTGRSDRMDWQTIELEREIRKANANAIVPVNSMFVDQGKQTAIDKANQTNISEEVKQLFNLGASDLEGHANQFRKVSREPSRLSDSEQGETERRAGREATELDSLDVVQNLMLIDNQDKTDGWDDYLPEPSRFREQGKVQTMSKHVKPDVFTV